MVALWGLCWDDTTGTAALARLGQQSGLHHRLGWGDTLRSLVPLIALSTTVHPSERKRKTQMKTFYQYICTVPYYTYYTDVVQNRSYLVIQGNTVLYSTYITVIRDGTYATL